MGGGKHSFFIRPAKKSDAKQALAVLAKAYKISFLKMSQKSNMDEALLLLEDFFKQPNNRLSYENILVCEVQGRIVGAICFYHSSLTDELFAPFKTDSKLQREAKGECFYIDAVAVKEGFRRRGICTALIKAAALKATKSGAKSPMQLVVHSQNTALKSYENMGFKKVAHCMFVGFSYYRLEKSLDSFR